MTTAAAVALLRFIGCSADSHTAALFFDDEIEARTVTTRLVGGRTAEAWAAYDALGLLQQLGAVPSGELART